MKIFDLKDVKNKARGNWLRILSENGIPSQFLKNKNGSCPFCGGKDRWRWDNKNENGSGFCHQCGGSMGFPNKAERKRALKKLEKLDGTLAQPANPTPLEKLRHDIQQKFVVYKHDKKIS